MNLKYKPNFSETQAYFDAFWQKEVIDRPLVCVTAPKNGTQPIGHDFFNANILKAKSDPVYFETLLKGFERYVQSTAFLGESIPYANFDFGPDTYASFFGAEMYASDTVATTWVEPSVTDWNAFTGEPDLSEDGMYMSYLRMLEFATKFSEGKFLIGCPDCHSNLDTISALRGPQDMCFDLMDYPDEVEGAIHRVQNFYRRFFEDIVRVGDMLKRGSIGWCPQYSRGRFAAVQCDAICLISPEQSSRFVIPFLVDECDAHDHVTYHYDGKEALPHLDRILAIEGIDVIQWVPGDGAPRTIEWMELLHKIQAAGKGLWLYDWTVDEIKSRFKELKPEGLCFSVNAASEDEAEELLEFLKKHN